MIREVYDRVLRPYCGVVLLLVKLCEFLSLFMLSIYALLGGLVGSESINQCPILLSKRVGQT